VVHAPDLIDETPTQVVSYGSAGPDDADADDRYEVTPMPTTADRGGSSGSYESFLPSSYPQSPPDERLSDPDHTGPAPRQPETSAQPTSSPWVREPDSTAISRQPEPALAPASSGPLTQTVIFQSVPNFQAALALERSLKAMADVREVRVADFDERQLTFQVTHELGDQLARVLLAQRGSELQLVEARGDRIELAFRS
jgi:hypothetical protein